MAKKLALNSKIGVLGEDIAVKFLMKQGFSISSRNYLKKWGEIDIIARKSKILHFIEVKSVSCVNISHETSTNPADTIHQSKLKRLGRVVETYILEEKWKGDWQIDALLIYLDEREREAKVEVLENITL